MHFCLCIQAAIEPTIRCRICETPGCRKPMALHFTPIVARFESDWSIDGYSSTDWSLPDLVNWSQAIPLPALGSKKERQLIANWQHPRTADRSIRGISTLIRLTLSKAISTPRHLSPLASTYQVVRINLDSSQVSGQLPANLARSQSLNSGHWRFNKWREAPETNRFQWWALSYRVGFDNPSTCCEKLSTMKPICSDASNHHRWPQLTQECKLIAMMSKNRMHFPHSTQFRHRFKLDWERQWKTRENCTT
jgi:hypothetical protein